MTRLGAKKKRKMGTWVLEARQPEEGEVLVFSGESGMMATGTSRKVIDDRAYSEEEVKIACEWTLVFMLMFENINSARWGIKCMEMAWLYPHGSYRHVFWWSARLLCREIGGEQPTLEQFRSYLDWKLAEFEPEGHIHRDGPVW